jgi:hypothetical protein
VKKIKKNGNSNSKFTIMYLLSSKNLQKFTGARLNHQEHNSTKKLKNLLRIAHKNLSKTAVFNFSKTFMARVKHPKILKKYSKFIIGNLVFE